MTREDMEKEYFEWLCHFVGCYHRRKLLSYLHSVDFYYNLPMDGNRYEDGVNLRYRFADEKGYHYRFIEQWIDNRDCSVLEMMVALTLKIENLMDGESEERPKRFFEKMLKSMGVDDMTDGKFVEVCASTAVRHMLDRAYHKNGDGGLFYLPRCKKDMRRVEIWYQAMWYLDDCFNSYGGKIC